MPSSRRQFLSDMGRGMLLASVGASLAEELEIATVFADDGPETLTFGKWEPLADLMQETPIDRLLPVLVERLKNGTSPKDLVAAAALANARTFGGEDYVGFHTFMALAPAYLMAQELPPERRPLPILKVLYRNTNRVHEFGGRSAEVLHPVAPGPLPGDRAPELVLRDAVHGRDVASAEKTLTALADRSADEAFNALLHTVEESTEVHRVVLAHRAWDMLRLVGQEHANTMLRQSLHYCVKNEEHSAKYFGGVRSLLPKLLDDYRLLDRSAGTRTADDAWVDSTSQSIFEATPDAAAELVAGALADGLAPEALGQAICLAANQLVLRDVGRTERMVQPNKPLGSVHGDSIGVHACDSAHAWRGIAAASNDRNRAACLILAGYQVALDRVNRGGDFLEWKPRPYQQDLEKVTASDADGLIDALHGAIRANDQSGACAVVHRYGELGYPARPVFDVLLGYGTSEDGALHAEKFYRTTSDNFAASRPAFRWRHLVALARVTASEFGQPAPGYAEACNLLGV